MVAAFAEGLDGFRAKQAVLTHAAGVQDAGDLAPQPAQAPVCCGNAHAALLPPDYVWRQIGFRRSLEEVLLARPVQEPFGREGKGPLRKFPVAEGRPKAQSAGFGQLPRPWADILRT